MSSARRTSAAITQASSETSPAGDWRARNDGTRRDERERRYAGMMVSRASSSHTGVVDSGFNEVGKQERRERQRASERRLARREGMRRAARHLGWWLAWQTRPTQ